PGLALPGEVAAEVGATGFLAGDRRGDHVPGDGEQVLQFPAGPGVELAGEDVPAPESHVPLGLGEPGGVADDAHLADHEATETVGDVGDVEAVGRGGRNPVR